jgi:STE24 endopeptidase
MCKGETVTVRLGGGRRSGRGPLLAVVAAVVAAEAAVALFWPRSGVIDPAPVEVASYFSAAELERARDFRRPQLALSLGVLAVELGLLAALVRRPPRRLLTPYRRPVLAAAVAGAALSVAVDAATLPLRAVARERARDVGLVTQSWAGYAGDQARSWALGALFAGAGAGVAVLLIRRFPRGWWAPASVAVAGFGVATIALGPVLLDPIFNRFEPLKPGPVRSDVLALARKAGVDVGEVYRMDASRRTTAANAYVAGLGDTKRVVLYDTLLDDFPREEIRLVVAHELGHVHHDDLPRGLLYVALVAPFGLFAAARLTDRLAPASGAAAGPATVPALALSVALVSTTIGWASNQLSRQVEARADSYAVRLTGEPRTLVAFERRIALRNVSDPDPPAWATFLFSTHPTTVERIGIGVAAARRDVEARP